LPHEKASPVRVAPSVLPGVWRRGAACSALLCSALTGRACLRRHARVRRARTVVAHRSCARTPAHPAGPVGPARAGRARSRANPPSGGALRGVRRAVGSGVQKHSWAAVSLSFAERQGRDRSHTEPISSTSP